MSDVINFFRLFHLISLYFIFLIKQQSVILDNLLHVSKFRSFGIMFSPVYLRRNST